MIFIIPIFEQRACYVLLPNLFLSVGIIILLNEAQAWNQSHLHMKMGAEGVHNELFMTFSSLAQCNHEGMDCVNDRVL